MPASHPKPKSKPRERTLSDAVIDEFLSLIEVDHDDWHRRMEKLHKELDKALGISRVGKTGAS
ncbi:MAG TPA: hypothetical protein VFS85_11920 [Dongiaceae bacterium]|jgi:hypothetical protein|nr:hypothetical protein [Dongiaceae bacterium]